MDRIKKLCSYLDKCVKFADVGCDHGYCTEYMLKNDLCKSAVVSDISARCLSKAERLLKDYIADGKCVSVNCSGLEKIDKDCDQVLMAGFGGEEIVNVMKAAYIPASFVLQPMKNARAVREFLIANGAEITVDETFKSGSKFYVLIKGKRDGVPTRYTEARLTYGNIDCPANMAYLKAELDKNEGYLKRKMTATSRVEIEKRIKLIKGILSGEIK